MRVVKLFDESCEWCYKIRAKHKLRKEIASKLNETELAEEFDVLSTYGKCPIHKHITAMPWEQKSIGKCRVYTEDYLIVMHWWTNNHDYKVYIYPLSKNAILEVDQYHFYIDYRDALETALKMASE